jgi:hypothetical protein
VSWQRRVLNNPGAAPKNEYRQPLSAKKKKETFRETVRKSIAKDVLTKERVRLFSKRAREYICAYVVLSQEEGRQNEDDAVNHCAAVPVKIEQLAKCEDIQIMWEDATGFGTSFPNSYQAYY